MVYPPEILDWLESTGGTKWEGVVWRHMLGRNPPERQNVRGARWNPPEVSAIYASLDRSTAVAEGDYAIAIQPIRPGASRTLYRIRIRLISVVDLTDRALLQHLGVGPEELRGPTHDACRVVGGAVSWLGHDGLLVPSARADGTNLVIYMANSSGPETGFEVVGSELLAGDARGG